MSSRVEDINSSRNLNPYELTEKELDDAYYEILELFESSASALFENPQITKNLGPIGEQHRIIEFKADGRPVTPPEPSTEPTPPTS